MDKREKVIRGLECCTHDTCVECPYKEEKCCTYWQPFPNMLLRDALELLKAQEPVKPEFVEHIEPDLSYWTCGAAVRLFGVMQWVRMLLKLSTIRIIVSIVDAR